MVFGEGSFVGLVLVKVEEVCLKEIVVFLIFVVDEVIISGFLCSGSNIKIDIFDIILVVEKVVVNDKDKLLKISVDVVFMVLINLLFFIWNEIMFFVFLEEKNILVILWYLWFEFLVNSMIIIDVIMERGIVIVKECFVYEGFYGFELDWFG